VAVVARAATGEWDKYYERVNERRALQADDPYMRNLQRHVFRERCLMAGSCLLLVGLVTTFYVVLMY
jgi:hypothetical protein